MLSESSGATKKLVLLSVLTQKFQEKFGYSDDMKKIIEQELKLLQNKAKISTEDIDQAETKISETMKAKGLQVLLGKRGQELNTSLKRPGSTIHSRPSSNRSFNQTPTHVTENIKDLSFTEGNTNNNQRIATYDDSRYRKAFQSYHIRTNNNRIVTEKTEKYLKAKEGDIWTRIYDHHDRQLEKKEKEFKESVIKKHEDWVSKLTEQHLIEQKRKMEQKQKKLAEEKEYIEKDYKKKETIENEEKQKKLETQIARRQEWGRQMQDLKTKMKIIKEKERKDALASIAKEQEKEKEEEIRAKEHKKKLMQEYLEANSILIVKKQEQERLKKVVNSEEESKAIIHGTAQIDKQEVETREFYEKIRTRGPRYPSSLPIREWGRSKTPNYSGNELESSENLLQFVVSKPDKSFELKAKREKQSVLKTFYLKQMNQKSERENSYRKMLNEQSNIWKADDEKYEIEQSIMKQLDMQKKEFFRGELLKQITEPKKPIDIAPQEVWVNRKLLKKLGVRPDGYSLDMAYRKAL